MATLLPNGLAPARVAPVFPTASRPDRKPTLPAGMTMADAQAQLDAHIFHHGIDFGDGLVSKSMAPPDYIDQIASAFFSPLDLNGRSMLDIGAWTGAYSFEAKWRGAKRVVASDQWSWVHPHFRGRAAFDLALSLTGLDIEPREIDVPDITPQSVGMFDVVLFSGVFYHLLDPIHLTRQVSECAEHLFIMETHHDAVKNARPSMIFYPGAELNGDSSNWWGPNPNCVYHLLRAFGFSEIWYCDAPRQKNRGIYHAFRNAESMKLLGWKPDGPWLSLSDPDNQALIFAPTDPG